MENKFDRNFISIISTDFFNQLELSLKEATKIRKDEELANLHKNISQKNLNSIRMEAISMLNSIKNWQEKLLDVTKEAIYPLLGQDLALQRQLNLSIQIPEDRSSILEKHVDYRSGDSPFQKVIWIAMTDAYGSNAMHMENEHGEYEPVEVSKGDVIIFDPNTPHGNIVNMTSKTRVSINIRTKNWFSPDLGSYIPDRQFGEYYEDWCFSESTRRAFSIMEEIV